MSFATLCDRCHAVIKNDDGYRLYAYTQKQTHEQFYRYGPHEESFDLCPACYRAVKSTIKEAR